MVYATTEPGEALLLGGYTAVLDQGELLQYGPTSEVFHRPASLRVARAFSDPPMNLVPCDGSALGVQLRGGPECPLDVWKGTGQTGATSITMGLRASALRVQARAGDVALAGKVELAEISGSDTYVHAHTAVGDLVAQLTGVHYFDLGAPITLHFSPEQVYLFDSAGALQLAPERHQGK